MERIVPANLDGDELWRRNGEYVDAESYDTAISRIAELEAQIAEIHASGLRLTFDHEWYVSGIRRDSGNYVLMRIGPAKDAETPF